MHAIYTICVEWSALQKYNLLMRNPWFVVIRAEMYIIVFLKDGNLSSFLCQDFKICQQNFFWQRLKYFGTASHQRTGVIVRWRVRNIHLGLTGIAHRKVMRSESHSEGVAGRIRKWRAAQVLRPTGKETHSRWERGEGNIYTQVCCQHFVCAVRWNGLTMVDVVPWYWNSP